MAPMGVHGLENRAGATSVEGSIPSPTAIFYLQAVSSIATCTSIAIALPRMYRKAFRLASRIRSARTHCGVEKQHLASLISWRSWVQVPATATNIQAWLSDQRIVNPRSMKPIGGRREVRFLGWAPCYGHQLVNA